MSKVKYFLWPVRVLKTRTGKIVLGVVLLAAAAAVLHFWLDLFTRKSDYHLPYLPTSVNTSVSEEAIPVNRLALQAHNASPFSQRRGFLIFIANVSAKPVRFDTRPFRQTVGLKAWAVDTEGKRHPSELRATYPEGNAAARISDVVTLLPGERFSQSVIIADPFTTKPMRAMEIPPYQVDHHLLSFEYAADGDLAEGIWHGKLTSNPFRFDQQAAPFLQRFKRRAYPKDLFHFRLNMLSARTDVGRRLLAVKHFLLLDRVSLLRKVQFERVLETAARDESPVVRIWVAYHPRTWPTLLVDADDEVRRHALLAVAGGLYYPELRRIHVGPILAATYHAGDARDRLLAIEALHCHRNGLPYNNLRDTIRKAFKDPDLKVRARAAELFKMWLPKEETAPRGAFSQVLEIPSPSGRRLVTIRSDKDGRPALQYRDSPEEALVVVKSWGLMPSVLWSPNGVRVAVTAADEPNIRWVESYMVSNRRLVGGRNITTRLPSLLRNAHYRRATALAWLPDSSALYVHLAEHADEAAGEGVFLLRAWDGKVLKSFRTGDLTDRPRSAKP